MVCRGKKMQEDPACICAQTPEALCPKGLACEDLLPRLDARANTFRGKHRVAQHRLKAGIDRLTLHGKDAEHALVDPMERLSTHEPLQGLDAKSKLANRE